MTHGAKATVFLRLSLMPLFLVHVGNGFAQDIGCPQVLCYSRAKPYIDAVRHFPWKLKMAFGWQNDPAQDLPTYVFRDSTEIQAFEFPNRLVALCFSEGSYAGAVIFRTNTDSVLAVYPWSEQVKGHLEEGYENNFGFYQTGYAFKENAKYDSWTLNIYTLAIVDTEYQVWHFELDTDLNYSGASRTLILTEKPYIPKGRRK